jgi:NAD(P)-dependent dehydrogenase (short-subunit alcohol dehydrogenase family)
MQIVMTGGTSGIGLEAVRSMLSRGVSRPIIGVRNPDMVPADIAGRIEPRILDLANLSSVRAFADGLAGQPIDILMLNAGGQISGSATSADGFERTFAVNHLAHYLLIRLLLPQMAQNGRIIITASGTHDPAAKTGMPAPRHADAQSLAFPDTDTTRKDSAAVEGRRAYSTSKLCNVMTARELAVRTVVERPDVSIMSLDPAFVPGTGLARDYPAWASWLFRNILPLVVRGEGVSTPPVSGRLLADLALEPAYAGQRGDYWSVRHKQLKNIAPSVLARDDAACAKLWNDSAALVGLT